NSVSAVPGHLPASQKATSCESVRPAHSASAVHAAQVCVVAVAQIGAAGSLQSSEVAHATHAPFPVSPAVSPSVRPAHSDGIVQPPQKCIAVQTGAVADGHIFESVHEVAPSGCPAGASIGDWQPLPGWSHAGFRVVHAAPSAHVPRTIARIPSL